MYRQPLTSDTLLSLQNNHGLDANLLLFCCWYAHTRGRLKADTIREALALSQPWANQVVAPLRAARNWMKLNTPEKKTSALGKADVASRHQQLREQIKALELQAEHLQEDMLESLLLTSGHAPLDQQPTTLESQVVDAVQNLQNLLEASAVPLNGDINELLATLITATLVTATLEETE